MQRRGVGGKMSELKELFEEGLEVNFEKDGRFIPVHLGIYDEERPGVVISVVERLGEELAKRSLQVIKDLDKHLSGSGYETAQKHFGQTEGVIVYLK